LSPATPSPQEQLQQLQALHTTGALTADEFEAARRRIEQGTPAAPPAPPRPGRTVWGLTAAFTLVLAVVGYGWTGQMAAVWQGAAAPSAAASSGEMPSPEQVQAMVQRLADRLKERPDDVEGWGMLARAHLMTGRLEEAAQASARALQLRPDDPQALADHADVLAMGSSQGLQGEPSRLIERALQIDPDHVKALALAGAADFERGDHAQAARRWDRVALLAPPGSPMAQQAREGAEEARRRAAVGLPSAGSTAAATPSAAAQPGATAARVIGQVRLAPALEGRADPLDTVFIFARHADAQAGRMPLAILRAQVRDLPLDFELDDRLAMGPGTGLSSASRVVVVARISRSGQAAPQPGDLEGQSAPVDVGARGVRVEISRTLP
jgi:cytochrome c-type biogenesis protein CcmH